MGSSPARSSAASSEFLKVFRTQADATGTMSFRRFMELALYHPGVGYYRKNRRRIGYGAGTDFFTASTSGSLFGQMVSAACTQRLRAAGRNPGTHVFVEIGSEVGGSGILTGVSHPFFGVRVLQIGEPLNVSGDCVVFSNELFDAQPFVRCVFRGRRWREIGVRAIGDNLTEVELDSEPPYQPPASTEGYHFDVPLAAAELVNVIAAQPWRGLFIAFDYGKTFRELAENTPAGTARAYFRHTQSNDLLARPGEQDLTCHVCWDWMGDELRRHGFAEPSLDFQEAFFIRHAGAFIAEVTAADAAGFSQRKLGLMQLLHGSHLGQKFQVLHAIRG